MEIWQRVQVAGIVALATALADVSTLLLLVFLDVQSDSHISSFWPLCAAIPSLFLFYSALSLTLKVCMCVFFYVCGGGRIVHAWRKMTASNVRGAGG